MKEDSFEEILKEQYRIKQREKHIDKIFEVAGCIICLATIFIIVVHFI